MKEVKIDAKGRKLGRLASEAATILQGKDSPDYSRNRVAEVKVVIQNASELDISEKKLKDKDYRRYSGYPGGLKSDTMEAVVEKKGYGEVVKRAVYGMLPSNKLRARIMKNLIVNE